MVIVRQISILQELTQIKPFVAFDTSIVLRSGAILKAEKDPPLQNLGLFGKNIDGSLALQIMEGAQEPPKV